MNTIKVFLSESGRVANLLKDFPLYRGQFNDKLLNVYVPTSILAPSFSVQHYIGQMSGADLPTTQALNDFVGQNTYPNTSEEPGVYFGREPMQGDIIEFVKVLGNTPQQYLLYTFNNSAWQSAEVDSFGTLNNLAGTSVKVGMLATRRNGTIYQSKSYFMRYLKTLTYQGIEYALYERKLPKEFTSFVGQGENAPTVVANVVNVDTNSGNVLSIITSQTCKLDVMQSTMLDEDETIEASDLTRLEADINELSAEMPLKQDKTDQSLDTPTKSVVGAINLLKGYTDTNTSDIATNASDIADIKLEQITQNEGISTNSDNISTNTNNIVDLQERVTALENTVVTGETYIGTMPSSATLPTDEQLTAFVVAEAGRQPQGGDYLYFTQIVTGTDKNYKYTYSSISGWGYSEIPGIEKATNSDYGIIKGTYGDSTKNTQVNIDDGEILDIRVKDGLNNMREVREYLNTSASSISSNTSNISSLTTRVGTVENKASTLEGQMTNILSGATSVGSATKATNDGLNRNIAQTYMTQTAGATKQDVYNYALPRAFNDVSFVGANNEMVDTVPSTITALYTATSTSVGDTTLFYVDKTIEQTEYQLASKNSYSDTLYVTASEDCSVQFRVTTAIYNNSQWITANIELTDVINMTSNEIKKVSFVSPFNYLDGILDIESGNIIRQTFEVETFVSNSITFSVYSNETYPSTFYLNTTSQTLVYEQGNLGEILVLNLDGVLSSNTLDFTISPTVSLFDKTLCEINLNYNGPVELTDEVRLKQNNSVIRLVTPYNPIAQAQVQDLRQTVASQFNGAEWKVFGMFAIENGDLVFRVQIDNLNDWVNRFGNQQIDGTKTFGERPRVSFHGTLPSAYQEVEWIHSDGTQAIDTGVMGQSGYTIEMDISFDELSTGNYQYVAGYAYTGSSDRLYYIRLNNSTDYLGYTYGADNASTSSLALLEENKFYNIKSEMKANLQRLYLDGTLVGSTTFGALSYDSQDPHNIYLFVANYVNSYNGWTKAKAKNVKIYDSTDTLIRNFVPCYRKSDNKVGMYDTVNDVFYANITNSSTDFTAGIDYEEVALLGDIANAEYDELATTDKTILGAINEINSEKQDALPQSSTANKFVKTTSTAGEYALSDTTGEKELLITYEDNTTETVRLVIYV